MVARKLGPHDLYREQVQMNPATYTGTPNSDDFRTSAVRGYAPTEQQRGLAPAYGSQQTVDSWIIQLRQKHIQV